MKYQIFNFEQDEKEIFLLTEDQNLYHLEHEDDISIIFKKDDIETDHLVIFKNSIIFFSRERKEDDGIIKTFVKILLKNNISYNFTSQD
jgi:hypothetical protein